MTLVLNRLRSSICQLISLENIRMFETEKNVIVLIYRGKKWRRSVSKVFVELNFRCCIQMSRLLHVFICLSLTCYTLTRSKCSTSYKLQWEHNVFSAIAHFTELNQISLLSIFLTGTLSRPTHTTNIFWFGGCGGISCGWERPVPHQKILNIFLCTHGLR